MRLASDLRRAGLSAVLAQPGRSLRGQMRHASALNARYTLVLGDAEVAAGTVQVKAMDSGDQRERRPWRKEAASFGGREFSRSWDCHL